MPKTREKPKLSKWEKYVLQRGRETSREFMAKARKERPRLKWSYDVMTYAIVKAAAVGAGIPAEILYNAKKNRRSPSRQICSALVMYSQGLLSMDDFRTTVDDEFLEWEDVYDDARGRKTRGA